MPPDGTEVLAPDSEDEIGGDKIFVEDIIHEFLGGDYSDDFLIFNNGNVLNLLFLEDLEGFSNGELGGVVLDLLEINGFEWLGSEWVAWSNKFLGFHESLFDHPFSLEELGDIVSDTVSEETDDSLVWSQSFSLSVVHGNSKDGTGTSSAEETFFSDKFSGHGLSFHVSDFEPFINDISIQILWDEIFSNSLDIMGLFVCIELLWHGQDGSVWINSNNFNIWIFFLDFSSNS